MEAIQRIAAHKVPSRPAEGTPPALADSGTLELADPMMDPVDRVLGLAVFDPAFRAELLANPAAALAPEPMPLGLKRGLVGVRAASLDEFARRALRAQALYAPAGSAPPISLGPDDRPASDWTGVGSLAGAGS